MVTRNSHVGLIATLRAHSTPPLDDLAGRCEWPLMLNATPRQLATELLLQNPDCLLIWLDDERWTHETARLVAWMRKRGNRPYRVAVAYRMEASVETLLRAAGVHSFLAIADQSAAQVTNAVWSLVNTSVRRAADRSIILAPSATMSVSSSAMQNSPGVVHPP